MTEDQFNKDGESYKQIQKDYEELGMVFAEPENFNEWKARNQFMRELLKDEVETIEVLPDNAKLSETILVGTSEFDAELQLEKDEKEQEEFDKYLEYVKQHIK